MKAYIYNIASQTSRAINDTMPTNQGIIELVGWSHDDRYLIYGGLANGTQVEMADIESNDQITLVNDTTMRRLLNYVWSDDYRKLYTLSSDRITGEQTVMLRDMTSPQTEKPLVTPGIFASDFALQRIYLSPDKQRVLYTATDTQSIPPQTTDLRSTPVTGGTSTKISDILNVSLVYSN
jgi:WD40 repeat protein